MSFQAMTWAVQQKLPATQKIVLLMLANRTNHDTGQCNPSYERLAEDSGMSVRSVHDQITKLEAAGLVTVMGNRVGGRKITNSFFLHLETMQNLQTMQITQQNPANHDSKTMQDLHIKQEDKPVIETDIVAHAPVTPNGATFSISEELRNCFHQHCKTLPHIKLLTPSRKQALKHRWMQAGKDLGRYDPKDIAAGLAWWARFFQAVDASDFLSGRNGVFKASFDWLLKQTNFIKILEGNYDNGARP